MPRGGPGKPRRKVDPMVRFFSFVQEDENGCWAWTGFKWKKHGSTTRACFWEGGRNHFAYRWLYEKIKGPVPDGLELDHQCNNPSCVNPAHLKAVTHRENIGRSNGICGVNSRKVVCIRSHQLSGDNLYVTPEGRRQCRLCRNEAGKKAYQRRIAVKAGG